MFLRIYQPQAELPRPTKADLPSAASFQELLGGKFGEMPGLNNELFERFNFHKKSRSQPFDSDAAWITAVKSGSIDLWTQPTFHQHNALECHATHLPRPRVSKRPPQSE